MPIGSILRLSKTSEPPGLEILGSRTKRAAETRAICIACPAYTGGLTFLSWGDYPCLVVLSTDNF